MEKYLSIAQLAERIRGREQFSVKYELEPPAVFSIRILADIPVSHRTEVFKLDHLRKCYLEAEPSCGLYFLEFASINSCILDNPHFSMCVPIDYHNATLEGSRLTIPTTAPYVPGTLIITEFKGAK